MIEHSVAEHIRKYGNERRNLQRGGGKRAGYFGLDGSLIQPSGGPFCRLTWQKRDRSTRTSPSWGAVQLVGGYAMSDKLGDGAGEIDEIICLVIPKPNRPVLGHREHVATFIFCEKVIQLALQCLTFFRSAWNPDSSIGFLADGVNEYLAANCLKYVSHRVAISLLSRRRFHSYFLGGRYFFSIDATTT
jgi:hypothetical protein